MITPRPYQKEGLAAVWNYFHAGNKGNPLLAWPTGCHAKGTEILMYDGSIKFIEHVEVDDLLIGPDSKPRRVLSLARGREAMVCITPTKGTPFVVNLSHILSLKTTTKDKYEKGQIENIIFSNYLRQSNWYKHTRKLWRTGVEFSSKSELLIHPRFMGIFLGDGGYAHNSISITSMDEEILDFCVDQIIKHGDDIRRSNNGSKANTLNIKRKIRKGGYKPNIGNLLNIYKLQGTLKHIPHPYKVASRQERLLLLAGLIDTDGSLSCGGYDYISVSQKLAEDVEFVARSLGFAAYTRPCRKKDQNGTEGIYHRVFISGNICEIPVLLKHKKASPRLQKKNHLVTGFSYEILPEDEYYGFELDQDNLYLTADFTVHHNTGKSVIPALFIYEVMQRWPNQRFLMITHVKELIEQNAEVMRMVWPNVPLGIYSAGIGHKQSQLPIVFGGIQSMIKNPSIFGHRDIIFIDEAHLVSDEDSSQYLTFIATMKLINPNIRIVGMTATPFRMGMGLLTEGKLFTDVVHDLTEMNQFNKMIEDGYMVPLVPKRTKTELDVTNVGMSKGDYIGSQLQYACDKTEVTHSLLKEVCEVAHNRKSWLIFASGIEHAEHIAELLQFFGVDCAPVHSKRNADYNNSAIKAFKSYSLRSIVCYSKLTTGFNHVGIDCIIDCRPTMSIPLHIQKLGRGTRPNGPSKKDCLVLDFSRNVPRLGPINDPIIPRKKSGEAGEVPVKICEACGVYNHLKVRFCTNCGNEFQFQIKIVAKSGNSEIIRSDQPIVEMFDVDRAIYMKRQKEGKNPYIRATYYCSGGMQAFSENIFPEHNHPYTKHLFHNWWKQRHVSEPPKNTNDCLQYIAELKTPKRIRVWVNKKNPDIMAVEF